MNPMLAPIQRHRSRIWLSLLGIALILLAGCSSGSNTQAPTATATSTTTSSTATTVPATTTTGATADWSALESKPLHLPDISAGATCPVTPSQQHIAPDHQYAAGNGPVYLVNEAANNPVIFLDAGSSDPGSPWKISKIFWEVSATYTGPAIVRGGQIDGASALNFNGGLGQTAGNNQGTEPILHELRLLGDPHGQWKTYLTFVRIKQAGCYAFQIDGQNFSENIVIRGTVG
jgi:hypothetical protein